MRPLELDVVDLGKMGYREAYERQVAEVDRLRDARDRGERLLGRVLLVEHDPVITLSRRAERNDHLLASEDLLREKGVALEQTDRGGDITYHGPGQLVAYPIVDLKVAGIGPFDHMRALEEATIRTLGVYGIEGGRDPNATGVWVTRADGSDAKIAAIGVRVRRWITMHGLALNVRTDLSHFDLIVACGLHGRDVTSMERQLGARCPTLDDVKRELGERLVEVLSEKAG